MCLSGNNHLVDKLLFDCDRHQDSVYIKLLVVDELLLLLDDWSCEANWCW